MLDNPHKRTDIDLVDKIVGYLDTDTVLFPVEVGMGTNGETMDRRKQLIMAMCEAYLSSILHILACISIAHLAELWLGMY